MQHCQNNAIAWYLNRKLLYKASLRLYFIQFLVLLSFCMELRNQCQSFNDKVLWAKDFLYICGVPYIVNAKLQKDF